MAAIRSPSNSPPYVPPKYTITVGRDNSLQWNPPPKSKELGFALSYYFPEEATMVGKMQAALRKWRRHQPNEPLQPTIEHGIIVHSLDSSSTSSCSACLGNATYIYSEAEIKRSASGRSPEFLPPSKQPKIPGAFTWRVGAKDEVVLKPTKRAYSKEERSEVGKNRGNACGYHRRRKQKFSYFA